VRAGELRRARAGRGPSQLVLDYGSRAGLVGRLTTDTGVPVVGARVSIISKVNGMPARWKAIATAVTRRNGTFRCTIPAGPSRQIVVTYTAAQQDPGPAAVARALLSVRAGVRVHFAQTYSRATTVVFPGLVFGPGIPTLGKLIEFQALRGSTWETFAYGRSDRHGRFRVSYQFAPGPASWHQLRVLVPSESGFPYAPGASAVSTVLVR
jgi:hypothetical protein